jgi:hypothetical protein
VKQESGGLLLLRRITPLPRRNTVYFCSGAYTILLRNSSTVILGASGMRSLLPLCTACAIAQDQGQNRHDQQAQSTHRVTTTNLTGWVRKDGDNYVLENDKDQQRYRIQNSEAVRAHEGHHVTVKARLHEDDRSLEVNRVKRLQK